MENKRLNLAEILREHVGETFYSPILGDVILENVRGRDFIYPLELRHISTDDGIHLDAYGRYVNNDEAACILFPSKDQRDWDVWAQQHRKMTYDDVAVELLGQGYYFTSELGAIYRNDTLPKCPNCALSKTQLEKLLAMNKLMNVQKWIEKGWQPDWNNSGAKYLLAIDSEDNSIFIYSQIHICCGVAYFSTKGNAQKAIDILGEDVIRRALSTDW